MAERNSVNVEFDERRFEFLSREAERLGCDVSQVVYRACAAWMNEMDDDGQLPKDMKIAEA